MVEAARASLRSVQFLRFALERYVDGPLPSVKCEGFNPDMLWAPRKTQ